jgi:hypothetical protein
MTVGIQEYLLANFLGPASPLGTLLTPAVLAAMLLARKLPGRTRGGSAAAGTTRRRSDSSPVHCL